MEAVKFTLVKSQCSSYVTSEPYGRQGVAFLLLCGHIERLNSQFLNFSDVSVKQGCSHRVFCVRLVKPNEKNPVFARPRIFEAANTCIISFEKNSAIDEIDEHPALLCLLNQ